MNKKEKHLGDSIILAIFAPLMLLFLVFIIVYDGFTLTSVGLMFGLALCIFLGWRDELSGINISKKEWYLRGLVSMFLFALAVLLMVDGDFPMYSVVAVLLVAIGILCFSYWWRIIKGSAKSVPVEKSVSMDMKKVYGYALKRTGLLVGISFVAFLVTLYFFSAFIP